MVQSKIWWWKLSHLQSFVEKVVYVEYIEKILTYKCPNFVPLVTLKSDSDCLFNLFLPLPDLFLGFVIFNLDNS